MQDECRFCQDNACSSIALERLRFRSLENVFTLPVVRLRTTFVSRDEIMITCLMDSGHNTQIALRKGLVCTLSTFQLLSINLKSTKATLLKRQVTRVCLFSKKVAKNQLKTHQPNYTTWRQRLSHISIKQVRVYNKFRNCEKLHSMIAN